MSVAILRPPIIYGPRDEAFMPLYRAIRYLRLMPLYGDGLNQLTFVHALDCAEAAVRLVLAETPSGAIYSVSDGAPHTWRDVAAAYAKAVGRKPLMLSVPRTVYQGVGAVADTLIRLTPLRLPIDAEAVLEMRQRYWVCDHEAITRDLAWHAAVRHRIGHGPNRRLVQGARLALASRIFKRVLETEAAWLQPSVWFQLTRRHKCHDFNVRRSFSP